MSLREKDYLRRAIEDLSKLVAKALGLKAKGRADEALDEFRQASGKLLDLPRETLDLLDPASVRRLLGDADRVRLYARVLEAEADLLEANGQNGNAASLRERARSVAGA